MLTPSAGSAYDVGMTAAIVTRTALYDAETGERIATSSPVITPEHAKDVKGWVLRYRAAYGRRTGRKIRAVQEPMTAAEYAEYEAREAAAHAR
jgi:hypothetical protein